MFEEMIKKIESFRYDENEVADDVLPYNDGLLKAIEIIKKYTQQPQDKPDSEGWWWFEPILAQTAWDLSIHYLSKDIYGHLMIPELHGKWYKAILPEVTK